MGEDGKAQVFSPLCRVGHKWVNLHGEACAAEKISMHENARKNTKGLWERGKGNIKNGEQKEWVGCWLANTKYSVHPWCGTTLWPRNKDVSMWSQLEECEKDLLITKAVASSYPAHYRDCCRESRRFSVRGLECFSHTVCKKNNKKHTPQTLSSLQCVYFFFLGNKKTSFYLFVPHKAGRWPVTK